VSERERENGRENGREGQRGGGGMGVGGGKRERPCCKTSRGTQGTCLSAWAAPLPRIPANDSPCPGCGV
jgi:hypothetical protein